MDTAILKFYLFFFFCHSMRSGKATCTTHFCQQIKVHFFHVLNALVRVPSACDCMYYVDP